MENSRTFQLDQAHLERLADKVDTMAWWRDGSLLSATIEVQGVGLRLVYRTLVETLEVTILHKPFYVSSDRVWNKIENYLAKGDSV